jgi:hypothetical protein
MYSLAIREIMPKRSLVALEPQTYAIDRLAVRGGATQDRFEMSADITTPAVRTMKILAYVHVRNIYRSTGAGRVARELMEHVALQDG